MTSTIKLISSILGFIIFWGLTTSYTKTNNSNTYYPINPIPFTSVKITDNFWTPRILTNYKVTIPIAIDQCYKTGRVNNFLYAGKIKDGQFCTQYPFDDTDIYKLIEAASYSLQTIPDKELEAQIDTLIYYVGKAQEPDGYLYTNRTINPDSTHAWAGKQRWINSPINMSHELYNCGHLYEAAVAHYQATNKKSLLNIAIKNANLLVTDFLKNGLQIYPGHQIIEMGLVRLYTTTGNEEYLKLAKYFLDVRGPGGQEYNQAHLKVVDQTEPVGHAVRATYMYSGMADIAAIYNDSSYLKASQLIWENLVTKKMYITGGIGSGGSNEGFDPEYVLPNMSAYCETCASVGNIFWNHRMFLFNGEGKYIDVLERTLYNALLSGVSLSGDHFFYPNVLESAGQHSRSKWFGCACCPPNIARLLPSLPGYIYAKTDKSIYINLFSDNSATIKIKSNEIKIKQKTNYPWNGEVEINITPTKKEYFDIKIRIPGWARGEVLPGDLYHFSNNKTAKYKIILNDKLVNTVVNNGYVTISKEWKENDKIKLSFPMEPQIILPNEKIKANSNRFAIQRGPLVYCAEWPYSENEKILNLFFDISQQFETEFDSTLLNGIVTIHAKAKPVSRTLNNKINIGNELNLRLIPYFAWNNKGPGEMMVWLPSDTNSVKPLPAPTIAYKSILSGSTENKTLEAIKDQYEPKNSNDHTMPFFHWWPKKNCWEWVQYTFNNPEIISKCNIYWFDDGPFGGCRIPETYTIEYKKDDQWIPVEITNGKKNIVKNNWDTTAFKPVKTNAIRLKVKLSNDYSAGIHEWIVN
ncbi:MAG: glycoside hydrolase family 127 protein [Marinilabiliaceae bacterium]|nr:glycoside hydrolase family 127 protein [Marinilabiliaceae bacterium]